MKAQILAAAIIIVSGFRLFSQEASLVNIQLNGEERFRFEASRLSFINPYSSVHIGDSAGAIGLNSLFNVAIGKLAGFNDTAGSNNVYIGAYSGYLEIYGVNNTYIGFGSGRVSDSAYSNTFIGSWSGRLNTSGSINTFIGRRAGNVNTTGSENTFLGQAAGFANTTGSYNTCIGRLSGFYNQTGNSNVFIGYSAGTDDNSSNRLVIANSQTPEPLIYGEFDNKMIRFNAGRMEIRNALGNTIIGDSSGTMVYGYSNVILGDRAGKYSRGGNQNTFIGYMAGYSDTTGSGNVFIGHQSGYSNTTGYRNTFVGASAGANNTTGMRNTCVGLSAGAYNNTGSYNTYLGRIAGYNNETGDSNVFVGNGAGQFEMGSNKLYISNSETSEPLIYGDFAGKKLEFNADSVQTTGTVQASGEVRSDQQFNTSGRAGITDTINTVTSYSFAQNKLKYRTSIITGGIITFLSEESAWVDSVSMPILHGLQVDFEDNTTGPLNPRVFGCGEWDYNLGIHPISESVLIVDNPDPSGINTSSKVMRFTRRGLNNGGLFWAGFFPTSDPAIDFTYNKFIHVKIYKPRISPVKFKIEDGDAGDLEIFSIYPQLDTNKWIDMVFDFSSKTGLYSAIALLPDYEDPLTLVGDIEIYFDDMLLNNDSVPRSCGDSLTDTRDGKKYSTVLIGSHCWMAENLSASEYLNGDPLPNITDSEEWVEHKPTGAYCWYSNDSSAYDSIYGKLYNWSAVMDSRGLCPAGWHAPTDGEWTTLTYLLGGESVAGGKLKETGTIHWQSPNEGATNESGFTALPGGGRGGVGNFDEVGYRGNWWTVTESEPGLTWRRELTFEGPVIVRSYVGSEYGYSVRCLKDD